MTFIAPRFLRVWFSAGVGFSFAVLIIATMVRTLWSFFHFLFVDMLTPYSCSGFSISNISTFKDMKLGWYHMLVDKESGFNPTVNIFSMLL